MIKYRYLLTYSIVSFVIIQLIYIADSKLYEINYHVDFLHFVVIAIISVIIGYIMDSKARYKKLQKQLLKAQKISKMGFWELDLYSNELYWSEEIFNIFEIDKTIFEASYDGFLNMIHLDDRDKVNEAYSTSLKTKKDYVIEHRLLMKDGRIKWVKEECHTKFDIDGVPLVSMGIVMDITALHLVQEKLIEQAYIDELTKLNNRKSYNENIEKLIHQYKRYDTPFSMLIFDIDNFKSINDNYGHLVGDNVLIDISKLVKSLIRESDHLFRIGGEEFVVLLTNTKIDKAIIVSKKILQGVEEDLKTIKDKKITISIGLAEIGKKDDEDTIFKRVDDFLYESKNNGKNKVTY